MSRYRASIDIGGTFTDAVFYNEDTGQYSAGKAPTTPGDLTQGVFNSLLGHVEPESFGFAVHGTTQGLNTFLERRGVRVLLLTTKGAGDVYHIARGPRKRLYDLHYRKPQALVPLRDTAEIGGRFDAQGEELEALDTEAVRQAAERVRRDDFGAVAVAYLFSYKNPSHEQHTRDILWEELGDDFPVSVSHEAAKEWREYERTSSVVVDAYTGPVVRRYLFRLEEQLRAKGLAVPLHVMQSNGGIITAESARQHPLQMLMSGPVGGAMGCVTLAHELNRANLIGVDMGGTSFDVSLVVGGEADLSPETQLEGLALLMPVVNIETIGAGGGSIAWTEAGGLRVGPRSAGADPGPACYGRGGIEPTVTDANLILGRIDPERFAGGQRLDTDAARGAVQRIANRVGLDTIEMAEGICAVANAKMAQAIRTITVSRGIEPRDYSLVAFGGAGPMHGVFLAQELGIREVVIPRYPGAFSAWGMLQTEIRQDFSEPYYVLDADLDQADMARQLRALEEQGRKFLLDENVPAESVAIRHAVDVRYAEQEYTITVPVESADEPLCGDFLRTLAARFAHHHQSRYGHSNLGAPIEVVTLRTAAFGDLGRAEPERIPQANGIDFPHEIRSVVFDRAPWETSVVWRDDLRAGHKLDGPVVILEDTATTVAPPQFTVTVDEIGSLLIRSKEQ